MFSEPQVKALSFSCFSTLNLLSSLFLAAP